MHKDSKNKYGFILASINRDYIKDDFCWVKDDEIVRVKKAFSYMDCFITKKVEEQTGKFYDETIYACNDPKAKIPLKKGLDPKKYGGYSGLQNAYYVVVEYLRNNKKIKKLVGIPIHISNMGKKGAVEEYLIQFEDIEDRSTLKILKNKIKKYQLLEYKGHEVYLISNTEFRSTVQLLVDNKYDELLYKISCNEGLKTIEDESNYNELMSSFIDYFVEKLYTYYPLYKSIGEHIEKSKNSFNKLEFNMKIDFIKELLKITEVKSKSRIGNFKKFNTPIKTTEAGRIRNRSNDGWNISDIVFIDKSITGLFERRYKI